MTCARTSYTRPFSLLAPWEKPPKIEHSPRGRPHNHHGWQNANVPATAGLHTGLGTCVRYRQLGDFGARRLPRKAGGDRNRHVSKDDPIVTYGGGEWRKFAEVSAVAATSPDQSIHTRRRGSLSQRPVACTDLHRERSGAFG